MMGKEEGNTEGTYNQCAVQRCPCPFHYLNFVLDTWDANYGADNFTPPTLPNFEQSCV
jgi:hypothetical protein